MARAYIVHARNDLSDIPRTGENHGLQVLDLWPNSSSRNQTLDPPGQTGYLSFKCLNDIVAINGIPEFSDTYYGVAAYIGDNVLDNAAPLNHFQANAVAYAFLRAVVQGSPLTLPDLKAIAGAVAGNGAIANFDFAGGSLGVEGLLRVLSGEVYRVKKDDAAGSVSGVFVTAPSAYAASQRLTEIGGVKVPVGGKSAFRGPLWAAKGKTRLTNKAQDHNYRNVRTFLDSSSLQLSAHSGMLAKLKSPTFTWKSNCFTYGPGGTALTIDTLPVPPNGIARALVVYAADGTLI